MVARAPRKRMYKTMQGRMIDIEKLRAANEDIRAVGNMNVNARGDQINSDGEIVKSREEIMKEYNKLNTMVPVDSEVQDSSEPISADDDWKDWEPPVKQQVEKDSKLTQEKVTSGGLESAVQRQKEHGGKNAS